MTIDWTKPIELATDPPRPARVVSGPDSDDHYYVSADWPDGCYGRCDRLFVFRDGSVVADDYGEYPRVRNVTTTPDLAAELAEALRDLLQQRPDYAVTAWDNAEEALAKYEAQEKAK